jgi:hypothetical protein
MCHQLDWCHLSYFYTFRTFWNTCWIIDKAEPKLESHKGDISWSPPYRKKKRKKKKSFEVVDSIFLHTAAHILYPE